MILSLGYIMSHSGTQVNISSNSAVAARSNNEFFKNRSCVIAC